MNDIDMANKKTSRVSKPVTPPPAAPAAGVSIAQTLYKTVATVGLTIALMALARFCHPVARGVNWVASTRAWESLYPVFAAESGEQRERMIMIGIIVACFLTAVLLVEGTLYAVRRMRR